MSGGDRPCSSCEADPMLRLRYRTTATQTYNGIPVRQRAWTNKPAKGYVRCDDVWHDLPLLEMKR